MANYKAYMTSSDLIASVKRKIMFPIAQGTFSEQDILEFANEEMMISQVPSVLQFHEEYFVFQKITPLVQNVSRYSIPNRAVGMRLRDVSCSDSSGNLYEMTRINADDKAYFQQNLGTSQSVYTYFLEGNDIVLAPSITSVPVTGNMNLFFYLRPNQLVPNSRAAKIVSFSKEISVEDNSLLAVNDQIDISYGVQTPNPSVFNLTATARVITSNSVATESVVTCAADHGYQPGEEFVVYISEVSGSTPSINGNHIATAVALDTFSIPVNVTVAGSGGFFALEDEFTIGSTAIQTAANIANTLTEYCDLTTANNSSAVATITYDDITLTVTSTIAAGSDGLYINEDEVVINFDQLPSTWTDPTTNETSALYTSGCLVDLLQTNPGHRTYNYDLTLETVSGNSGTFLKRELQYYASTGTGQTLVFLPFTVGDYICLANECIIPQIPPDLHTGLAERTAARIQAAMGDQTGLDRSNAKIAEIEQRQGTLLDQRVDGSAQKVVNRKGLLRSFKRTRWGV